MKNTLLSILSFAIFLGSVTVLSAHALIVDTQPTGKSGVEHEVIVFYAEPADGIKETITDWWADVSEFTLWLHLPDGTKQQLDATPNGDHFTAAFTPDASGVYYLSVSHAVNQLAGTTQYVFNASAHVLVGKNTDPTAVKPVTDDQMILVDNAHRLKRKKQVSLNYFYDKKPVAQSSLAVFSPAGWEKTIQTQSGGNTSFVPEWKGKYVIESIHKEEATDQPYEERVEIYTTSLVVR